MQRKKLVGWLTAFVAFALAVLVPTQAMASPPPVTYLPDSAVLAPGQTQAVAISLSEPIICATGPCNVVLDFSASQTLGVTVTPSVVTFADTAWFTPQTVTVALALNTSAQYPQIVNLVAVAASNSEYYRNYRTQFPVSLNVPDIRPPAPAPVDPTLANTGAHNLEIASLVGFMSVATGFVLAFYVRRNKKLMRRSSR